MYCTPFIKTLSSVRRELEATRTPSIKTLSSVFSDPAEAKRILRMSRRELEATPAGAARVAECYHSPDTCDVRLHVLNTAEASLHGIETVQFGSEFADYLNTGDSYAPTLIYWRGNYRVQSVGDFIETLERNGMRAA